MDYLDDFVCEIQADEHFYESLFNLAEQEYYDPEYYYNDDNAMAENRKSDWHHAKRNYRVLRAKYSKEFLKFFKPIHYYSKTKPEFYYQRRNKTNNKGKHRNAYGNYNPSKNWSPADKRKIQDGENQLKELFDNE